MTTRMSRRLYRAEERALDDAFEAMYADKHAIRVAYFGAPESERDGLADALAECVEAHRRYVASIERRYARRRRLLGWVPV